MPDFPPPCRDASSAGCAIAGRPSRDWLTRRWRAAHGEVVGYVRLALPLLDNTENAQVETRACTRSTGGAASAGRCYDARRATAPASTGRKRMVGDTVGRAARRAGAAGAGGAFAAAHGRASRALAEVRRRLDLTTAGRPPSRPSCSPTPGRRPTGYRLVAVAGRGARGVRRRRRLPGRPADHRRAHGRPGLGAGEVDVAPDPRDRGAPAGRQAAPVLHRGGARAHRPAGRLDRAGPAALPAGTPRSRSPSSTRQHRGHRLGTIVKLENLRYALAHEPELRVIDTWNAAVNDT